MPQHIIFATQLNTFISSSLYFHTLMRDIFREGWAINIEMIFMLNENENLFSRFYAKEINKNIFPHFNTFFSTNVKSLADNGTKVYGL